MSLPSSSVPSLSLASPTSNNNHDSSSSNNGTAHRAARGRVSRHRRQSKTTETTAATAQQPPRRRRNPNNRRPEQQQQQQQQLSSTSNRGPSPSDTPTSSGSDSDRSRSNQHTNDKKRHNKGNHRKGKHHPKVKHPADTYPSSSWRSLLPVDSVDPITLEPLETLPYPPFALYAEGPFDPIDVWPSPEQELQEDGTTAAAAATTTTTTTTSGGERPTTKTAKEDESERQRRILQDQWGDQLSSSGASTTDETTRRRRHHRVGRRHTHLYDGRALAYYVVSSGQFVDPLNRRDVTRDEWLALDRYLRRHGLQGNVVEAYDAHGITVSAAGAAAHTAEGRAQRLREQATQLLEALFVSSTHRGTLGSASSSTRRFSHELATSRSNHSYNNNNNNAASSLASQYHAHESYEEEQRLQQQQEHRSIQVTPRSSSPPHHQNSGVNDNSSLSREGAGMVVIDDDLFPELRAAQGVVPTTNPTPESTTLVRSTPPALQFSQWNKRRTPNHLSSPDEFPTLLKTNTPSSSALASTRKSFLRVKNRVLERSQERSAWVPRPNRNT